MYKMVLMDYRSHWKSCFVANVKDMTMLPLLLIILMQNAWYSFLIYLCMAVPFIISRVYGDITDKTFMLLPLSEEERISYGKCGYIVRTTVSLIFVMIINVIIFAAIDYPVLPKIFALITNVISIFLFNIYIRPVDGKYKAGYLEWQIIGIVVIILTLIINGCFETTDSTGVILGFNIPLILVQVLIFLNVYRKFFKLSVDSTTCYGNGGSYEDNH